MQITFTAQSARELHDKIVSFCKEFGVSNESSKQQTLNLVPTGGIVAGAPAADADKPARTRRTKAQIEADEAAAKAATPPPANTDFTGEPVQTPPPVAQVQAAPTQAAAAPLPAQKQQVTDALTSVNGKHGLAIARGVLMKFGTDRLSSLSVDRYPDFLVLTGKIVAVGTVAEAQALLA